MSALNVTVIRSPQGWPRGDAIAHSCGFTAGAISSRYVQGSSPNRPTRVAHKASGRTTTDHLTPVSTPVGRLPFTSSTDPDWLPIKESIMTVVSSGHGLQGGLS